MSLLSTEDKRFLLHLARNSLEASVCGRSAADPVREVPETLQLPGGAFVTLHAAGSLRGCVGFVFPGDPLYRIVIEAAAAAALRDSRFLPVSPAELAALEVEISVLSPPWQVRAEEVRAGIHGLIVSQGDLRGLLLPQVAEERSWSALRLLEETCRKAGLPPSAWRYGAKIEAFTAEVFSERELADAEPRN